MHWSLFRSNGNTALLVYILTYMASQVDRDISTDSTEAAETVVRRQDVEKS